MGTGSKLNEYFSFEIIDPHKYRDKCRSPKIKFKKIKPSGTMLRVWLRAVKVKRSAYMVDFKFKSNTQNDNIVCPQRHVIISNKEENSFICIGKDSISSIELSFGYCILKEQKRRIWKLC